ncbi:hypothetical protein G4V62_13975 [Bacillaceae bacterium SIJ1]|uniref:hypothetical protein n=1 Tax=Litoribacterium kuwaitense TaxID=1398745 RepID=UPI0013EDFA35|nr:hypothetical protein [Litoribacterium kuwaitense]NGP46002.1 hypothetical protein [Litoribacterium kuwaitense]
MKIKVMKEVFNQELYGKVVYLRGMDSDRKKYDDAFLVYRVGEDNQEILSVVDRYSEIHDIHISDINDKNISVRVIEVDGNTPVSDTTPKAPKAGGVVKLEDSQYVLSEEHAKRGEKIMIVNARSDRYRTYGNGSIFTALRTDHQGVWCAGAVQFGNILGDVKHEEYLTLKPLSFEEAEDDDE